MEKKYYTTETTSSKARKMDTLVEEGSETETDEDSYDDDSDEDEEGSQDENNNQKDYELVKFKKKKEKQDRLDCESIISTYSNIYNRPAVISDKEERNKKQAEGGIQLSTKTGLPLGVLPEKAKSKNQMDKIEHKITRIIPEMPTRKECETKEEKKARKQAIKEHRRERRVEKKINKLAFKEEKKIQVGQLNSMQDASRTVRLPL
jgi:protein LTV1